MNQNFLDLKVTKTHVERKVYTERKQLFNMTKCSFSQCGRQINKNV